MKVFKMDDETWIAAETAGQAVDFYLEECDGVGLEDLLLIECDIDKSDSMWWIIDINDVPKSKTYDILSGDEFTHKGIKYGTWDGEPAKMISYKEAHDLYSENMPYIIASCL